MPSVKHSSEYSEKFNIFLSFLAENKFLHIIIWKFFDRMGRDYGSGEEDDSHGLCIQIRT